MAKFEKFNPGKQTHGLTEAARQIQIEELTRQGKMVSFDQVVTAIEETRQKYRPLILATRQKEPAGSRRERKQSHRVN
jgi:hypothetical protein